MPRWGGFSFLLLGILSAAPSGYSYSCSGPSFCEAPRPNDVIFVGEVIREGHNALSDQEPAAPALFRIEDRFHGLDAEIKEVEVWSPFFKSFGKGSRWVIDAVRTSDGDSTLLNTRECGRSGRLDESQSGLRQYAREFLSHLEARRAGTAKTTIILHPYTSTASGIRKIGPMTVRLEGSREYTFHPSEDGKLEAIEIEPGIYRVEALDARYPYLGPESISVPRGSCTDALLRFGPDTRISGHVTASDGAPVKNRAVIVENLETGEDELTTTDDEGRYEVRGVAPGDYFVRAITPGHQETYHPGTSAKALAAKVLVGAGLPVTEIGIQLADEAVANVTLVIVGLDGGLVVSTAVSVWVKELFEGQEETSWSIGETDYKGRFEVVSRVGARLELVVSAGPAAAISSHSNEPLETGASELAVVSPAQTERVHLTERRCKVGLLKWEPCPNTAGN